MEAQCLMETDKECCDSPKSYQRIQIPLLMPCRYGTDTADIWGRICGEGETIQLQRRAVYGQLNGIIFINAGFYNSDVYGSNKVAAIQY